MQKVCGTGSCRSGTIRTVKSIRFRYTASQELSSLFEDFRLMCNDAIRIALEGKPRSKFQLIELAYKRLKEYGLHTHYILSACQVAYSVYKNKNRRSNPHLKHVFLKVDSQSYQLNHLVLRIPVRPRHFIFLVLHSSDYHQAFLDDPNLKRGEIVLTQQAAIIPLSKYVTVAQQPHGQIGVDVNERNVTWSDTIGRIGREDISEVPEIKERYKEARAKIGRSTRQDGRISGRLYAKYGRKEKNRTVQVLHLVSKKIVTEAKNKQLGICLEKLKGIRKLYRGGNGQGASFRGRMNSWTFHEIQRQIEYKAAWIGVPVYYVNPRGTSRNCPDCGSRVAPLQDRKLYCQECDKTWDRDGLASKNIMACVVPQARPPKGSNEKERGDDGSNPSSRWAEVRLVVLDRPSG